MDLTSCLTEANVYMKNNFSTLADLLMNIFVPGKYICGNFLKNKYIFIFT